MIYSNFYWHLKEVYDLFPVQYKVRSISFFESVPNLWGREERLGVTHHLYLGRYYVSTRFTTMNYVAV